MCEIIDPVRVIVAMLAGWFEGGVGSVLVWNLWGDIPCAPPTCVNIHCMSVCECIHEREREREREREEEREIEREREPKSRKSLNLYYLPYYFNHYDLNVKFEYMCCVVYLHCVLYCTISCNVYVQLVP